MSGPGDIVHVDYGPDTREEIEIKKKLFDLRCEYQEKAEPLIERLAQLQAQKPIRMVVVHP